jgi:hypoxanthine phosphoribosyltransferase
LSHKKSERREQINVNNIVLPVVTPAAPRRAVPDSPPPSCVIMEVLLTAEELAAGIGRLSAAVRQVVGRRPLTVVGVLTGSIVLVSDLIRRLEGPVQVSMVWASSYRGTATSPGALELRLDLLPDLTGKEVLLVDDIFDTGRTLDALMQGLRRRGAASVRSLVLLRKAGRAEVALQPDFVGFDIPDAFVVGYGLDFDGAWRHLPYLAALDSADIAAARAGQRSHDAEPAPQADPAGVPRA